MKTYLRNQLSSPRLLHLFARQHPVAKKLSTSYEQYSAIFDTDSISVAPTVAAGVRMRSDAEFKASKTQDFAVEYSPKAKCEVLLR